MSPQEKVYEYSTAEFVLILLFCKRFQVLKCRALIARAKHLERVSSKRTGGGDEIRHPERAMVHLSIRHLSVFSSHQYFVLSLDNRVTSKIWKYRQLL